MHSHIRPVRWTSVWTGSPFRKEESFGVLSAEYEFAFLHWLSVAVGPHFVLFHPLSGSERQDYGLSLTTRFVLTGQAPEGFWVGAEFTGAIAVDRSKVGFAIGLGPQIGYTWFWGAFGLSIGGGFSVRGFDVGVVAGSEIVPSLRFSIGVATCARAVNWQDCNRPRAGAPNN